ncbi:MAG TPA: type I methionyl aminopeptidase [Candidatus Saccharimonadales bacterium]|nr:type I methionyl aminopeptidase [Candidatus Saccharimonadales bacterium]
MRPKSDKEVEAMREGGRMLAAVLALAEKNLKPGISTKELSDIAHKEVVALGGQPSFLNHEDFPEAMCVSVNAELVHGLPSPKTVIKEGDVVGLDFGVMYRGLVTDGATTAYVGSAPPADVKRLLEGTSKSLDAGIAAVKGDGTRVGDIGAAVQKVLEKQYKLGVIRDLVGHGVGDKVHENPNIPNYGVSGTGALLSAGMTICIEPMASLGDWQIEVAKDGWTVVMSDGSLSAHFEHTVLITEKGAEILTAS